MYRVGTPNAVVAVPVCDPTLSNAALFVMLSASRNTLRLVCADAGPVRALVAIRPSDLDRTSEITPCQLCDIRLVSMNVAPLYFENNPRPSGPLGVVSRKTRSLAGVSSRQTCTG